MFDYDTNGSYLVGFCSVVIFDDFRGTGKDSMMIVFRISVVATDLEVESLIVVVRMIWMKMIMIIDLEEMFQVDLLDMFCLKSTHLQSGMVVILATSPTMTNSLVNSEQIVSCVSSWFPSGWSISVYLTITSRTVCLIDG